MTETNSPDRWTVEVDRANELEASSTLKGIQTDAVLGGMAFLINEIWDHYRNLSERRVRVNVPCLLYTSPSPRDRQKSRMPSSA